VNGWQVSSVLAGLGVFIVGAVVSLLPVGAPITEDGPATAIPALDPVAAFERAPDRVLLALGLILLGLAIAVAGAFVTRDHERRTSPYR
jgi:hypothetical protein